MSEVLGGVGEMNAAAKTPRPLAFWTAVGEVGLAYIQTSAGLTPSAARYRAQTIGFNLSLNFEDYERNQIRVYRAPLLDEADFWEKIERGEHGQKAYDIHEENSEIESALIRLGVARLEEGDHPAMVFCSSPRAMAAHDEREAQ